MKVEDVALHIYCALATLADRDAPDDDTPTEAEKKTLARRAFTYASAFLSVCQEETEGKR